MDRARTSPASMEPPEVVVGTTGLRRRAAIAVRYSASSVRAVPGRAVHSVRQRAQPDRWTHVSPHRIVYVSADDVSLLTARRLPEGVRGQRIAGDWDIEALEVDKVGLAAALRRRFIDGSDWESCGLVEAGASPEAPGVASDRYRTMSAAAIRQRMSGLDALHASLMRDGWRPHYEIAAPFIKEMAVCRGRDGRYIRNRGGLHRLIIARLLGLDRIPVRLLAEHSDSPVSRAPRERH